MAAHHVADVELGGLVVAHVDHSKPPATKLGDELLALGVPLGELHPGEHLRPAGVGVAVVELGDLAVPERAAKAEEAPGPLGDLHRQQGLAPLTQLGALRHMAQPVEIEVGTTEDRDLRLARHPRALQVALDPGNRQRPRRLGDHPQVVEQILDRGTDLVGADQNHLVHQLPRQPEGLRPDLAHRHPVGKQPHPLQGDGTIRGQGGVQGRGIVGLHADHPGLGPDVFHVGGHPRDQPPAAHRDKDGMGRIGVLTQDLHADGALSGDHLGVVEGVDEGQPLPAAKLQGVGVGVVVGIPMEQGLRPQPAHRPNLDRWGGPRHHDQGSDPQPLCRQRHTLGMIAGGGGDHAARALRRRQAKHLVVGPPQLEGEHRLQVLALGEHRIAETLRQAREPLQGRLLGNIVDPGLEDTFDVAARHGGGEQPELARILLPLSGRYHSEANWVTADGDNTLMNADELKLTAAKAALDYVKDGVIGVGTGSTVNHFIDLLAGVKHKIDGAVSSSEASTQRLKARGVPVIDLNAAGDLDLYVDGADESNHQLELIKGGGGALTREKIVAAASRRFVCIADESKLVRVLGRFPLPVEVIPMARSYVARQLVKLGGTPTWREGLVTDNGNLILDVHNLEILEPMKLEQTLNNIPGVVTVGLFALRGADVLILGTPTGPRTLTAS